MASGLHMPLRRSKKVRIVSRGPVFLASPLVREDAIYVGHYEHDLLKFDQRLNLLWRVPLDGFDVLGSVGDVVLLLHHRFDSRSRVVRAVHSSSGAVLWSRELTGWGLWRDRLIVRAASGVSLVDIATGSEVEQIDLGGAIDGGVLGDVFLFRRRDRQEVECAFDLTERRHLWQRNLFEAIQSRFVIWGEEQVLGRALGSPGRFLGTYADHILGFSMQDGSPRWCVPGFVPRGLPLVCDGRVYAWICDKADNYASYLLCIDEGSGEIIYNRAMKPYGEPALLGTNAWPPVLVGEYLLVPTASSFLAAFRLADGELVWSFRHEGEMYPPVVADDRLLVTSADGNLLVFESADTPAS